MNEVLKVIAREDDVLLLSKVGEIVSEKAVKEFLNSELEFACTKLIFFYEHWDQMLTEKTGAAEVKPFFWYEGVRVVSLKTFIDDFRNSTYDLRRTDKCDQALFGGDSSPKGLLREQGWFFSTKKEDLFEMQFLHEKTELKQVNLGSGFLPKEVAELTGNSSSDSYRFRLKEFAG